MNRYVVTGAIGAAVLAALVALPVMAQRPAAPDATENPMQGNAEAAVAGQKVYETTCLACHAVNGGAGEIGPALVNSTRSDAPRTPGQVFGVIKNGVPGTRMPPFANIVPDDDIWRVVTYIQSLRGTAVDSPAPGDFRAGEQVFFGKGQCSSCHMVNAKGAVTAPDLSNIAASRKTQQIVDALTKPYHKIYGPGGAHLRELPAAGEWRSLKVTTLDGRVFTGVLINEDNYGLQMMGDDQKLHLFIRAKLRQVIIEPRSRMPTDFDKRLSPEEFRNLVAFLTRQANMPRAGGARRAG